MDVQGLSRQDLAAEGGLPHPHEQGKGACVPLGGHHQNVRGLSHRLDGVDAGKNRRAGKVAGKGGQVGPGQKGGHNLLAGHQAAHLVDEQHGWMLKVTDAALGSRFYELNRTEDGGTTWETVNTDPFAGNMGVAEGLQFYDENFGFAALTGASQSSSRMYMTKDGGSTFTEILLPMDTVTELPENAQKLGYSLENYAYLCMPEKNGEVWTIDVLAEAAGSEGLRFRSEDRGATWVYEGTF